MGEGNGLYQTPFQTFWEFFKVIGVALLIALVIRTFVVQPYIIPSESMLNTLQVGDRIFVTKYSYGIHVPFVEKELVSTGQPELGDIIVFPYPKDPELDYIKRVVGLPGDVMEVRNKQLLRNGKPVLESYIRHADPNIIPGWRDNMAPVTVPEGHVFVMGDNRDNSADSREWGFVDKSVIRGKAQMIFWSSQNWFDIRWNRIGKSLY